MKKNPELYREFLKAMFTNNLTLKTHTDNKSNWLMGTSGVIMSITLSLLTKPETTNITPGLMIIFIGAFLSFVISLLNLDIPAIFLKKLHLPKNRMFYKYYLNKDLNQLKKEFKTLQSEEAITEQYIINMITLAERSLKFKTQWLDWSRNILLFACIIGFVVTIILFIV